MSETVMAVCEHLKTLGWSDYVRCLRCGAVVREGSAPVAPVAVIAMATVTVTMPADHAGALRAWVAERGGSASEGGQA